MQATLLLETKKSECHTTQYTFTHHLLLSSKFTILTVKTLYGSCFESVQNHKWRYDVRCARAYVVKKFLLVVEYMIARHYNTWVILRSMHVQKCATLLRGLFCYHELTIFTSWFGHHVHCRKKKRSFQFKDELRHLIEKETILICKGRSLAATKKKALSI